MKNKIEALLLMVGLCFEITITLCDLTGMFAGSIVRVCGRVSLVSVGMDGIG